jgi:hypothetical protein
VHVAIKLYEIRKQNQRAFCAFDEGALKYSGACKVRTAKIVCASAELGAWPKFQIALRLSRKGCRRFFRMPEALSCDEKMFTVPEQSSLFGKFFEGLLVEERRGAVVDTRQSMAFHERES